MDTIRGLGDIFAAYHCSNFYFGETRQREIADLVKAFPNLKGIDVSNDKLNNVAPKVLHLDLTDRALKNSAAVVAAAFGSG